METTDVKRLQRYMPSTRVSAVTGSPQMDRINGQPSVGYCNAADVAPLEDRLAETEAENAELMDRHEALHTELGTANLQNARLVALLREYTEGYEDMPDEKLQALKLGLHRPYAKRELRRRALLAESEGGAK